MAFDAAVAGFETTNRMRFGAAGCPRAGPKGIITSADAPAAPSHVWRLLISSSDILFLVSGW